MTRWNHPLPRPLWLITPRRYHRLWRWHTCDSKGTLADTCKLLADLYKRFLQLMVLLGKFKMGPEKFVVTSIFIVDYMCLLDGLDERFEMMQISPLLVAKAFLCNAVLRTFFADAASLKLGGCLLLSARARAIPAC